MEIKDGDTGRHWEIADQTKNVEELYARRERMEDLNRAIRVYTPLCGMWLRFVSPTICL